MPAPRGRSAEAPPNETRYSRPFLLWRAQATGRDDELGDIGHAGAAADICEAEGAVAAHLLRVAVHQLEARTDNGRQLDLVDPKHVRTGYDGPTLSRDIATRRPVNDRDGDGAHIGTEGNRKRGGRAKGGLVRVIPGG